MDGNISLQMKQVIIFTRRLIENRMKIRLKTPEETTEFINICSAYDSDINVLDGSIMLDAKSIVSMFGITNGKIVEVEMISNNKKEVERFVERIRKFEV